MVLWLITFLFDVFRDEQVLRMPPYGRHRPASEPLLENLEVHLQQIVSSAAAALRVLKITKRNFTALRQAEANTSAESELSNLTDSQVLSKNLLEAVRLVGAKAVATVAIAERAIISQKESEDIGRSTPQGTAFQQGPSVKTARRKRLRDASKMARQLVGSGDTQQTTAENILVADNLGVPKSTSARSASKTKYSKQEHPPGTSVVKQATATRLPAQPEKHSKRKQNKTISSDCSGRIHLEEQSFLQTCKNSELEPSATKPSCKSKKRSGSQEPSTYSAILQSPSASDS